MRTDYVQPRNEGYEERVCTTVMMGEMNVAEALISKGLGSVIRYRADDDKRSSAYDALLAAEAVAQKKAVGIHSKKEPPTHRVADITGEDFSGSLFSTLVCMAGRLGSSCDRLPLQAAVGRCPVARLLLLQREGVARRGC